MSRDTHRLQQRVLAFEARTGRRPRVLLVGEDTAADSQKLQGIAAFLADLGLDVDLGPRVRTPAAVARMAVDHDVHVILLLAAASRATGRSEALGRHLAQARAGEIRILVHDGREPADLAAKLLGKIENPD